MEIPDQEIDDIIKDLTESIEAETNKEIFTLRVLKDVKEGMETLVVFKDKSVLMALIDIDMMKDKMAIRIKGNYI